MANGEHTRRQLLIVDRDPAVVEALCDLLEGERVMATRSMEEAIDLAERGGIHAAVLGPSFGHEAGIRSAGALLDAGRPITVILVANVVTNRVLKSALEVGLADVIEAPLTLSELHDVLDRAGDLQGSPSGDPFVEQAAAAVRETAQVTAVGPPATGWSDRPVPAADGGEWFEDPLGEASSAGARPASIDEALGPITPPVYRLPPDPFVDAPVPDVPAWPIPVEDLEGSSSEPVRPFDPDQAPATFEFTIEAIEPSAPAAPEDRAEDASIEPAPPEADEEGQAGVWHLGPLDDDKAVPTDWDAPSGSETPDLTDLPPFPENAPPLPAEPPPLPDARSGTLIGAEPAAGPPEPEPVPASAEMIDDLFGPGPRILRDPTGRGRVIAVVAGKGGSGKTVTAVNVAIALRQRSDDASVALVDADLQFGDVALLLQLDPVATLADAARVADELGREQIDSLMLHHESGIGVLPAPVVPGRPGIGAKQVVMVIERLQAVYDYVVVDTSAVFDDVLIGILESADVALIVVDMDLASVKNAKVALEALRADEFPIGRMRLVVNRVNAKARLDLAEVERSLGLDVFASLPSDKVVPQSVNEGIPAIGLSPRSKIAKGFRRLADLLLDTED